MKRTKIIATMGPSMDNEDVLSSMIDKGVNIIRLNFSHISKDCAHKYVKIINTVSLKKTIKIGILADLQGPKIRITKFEKGFVVLDKGSNFILDFNMRFSFGNINSVGFDYKYLCFDVKTGDILVLDDGNIELLVYNIVEKKIFCTVIIGGKLFNNKGINKKGGGLTASALTDKDKDDIKIISKLNIDYVAISFTCNEMDIIYARQLLMEANISAFVVAKIERNEALLNLEGIIKASDAVMVARGDLSIEVGHEKVPLLQKMIIEKTKKLNKFSIVATQMMESMNSNKVPTRSESSDVANAILDGADAIMLSAETATGKYPLLTIEAMYKICIESEKYMFNILNKNKKYYFNSDDSFDYCIEIALKMKVNSIILNIDNKLFLDKLSKLKTNIPIYIISNNVYILRKISIIPGVFSVSYNISDKLVFLNFINFLKKHAFIKKGDIVMFNKLNFKDQLFTDITRIIKIL